MKKIVLLFSAALFTAHTNSSFGQPSSTSASATMTTLNGYSLDQANQMVNAFIAAPGSYTSGTRTNVWFSKAIIHSIDSLLNAEMNEDISLGRSSKTDGLRIYFALDRNGYNLILVATRSQGSDDSGNLIHQDYFRHKAPFLSNPSVKGTVDHGLSKIGQVSYSDLYNYTCPANSNCTITGDPNHYIDCQTAISWINNYGTASTDAFVEGSEWFDLDLIDNLNNELQKETNGADGIRIYFSKSPADNSHRLILVTTQLINNVTTDYYDCIPQMNNQFLQLQLRKKSAIIKKQSLSRPFIGGNNNGEECPTNCQGITWP